MPKKKRGHGFTHSKRGRQGGRGTVGNKRWPGKTQVSTVYLLESETPKAGPSKPDNCTKEASETKCSRLHYSIENENMQDPLNSCTLASACTTLVSSSADANALASEEKAADALQLLNGVLPLNWKAVQGPEGFHIILTSSVKNEAAQREIFAPFAGKIELFVHKKRLSEYLHQIVVKDLTDIVSLKSSSKVYVDNILNVVLAVRRFEICAGADPKIKFSEFWKEDDLGYVDNNPFEESRYKATFRSKHCVMLVPVSVWKCGECAKGTNRLRAKMKRHKDDEAKSYTRRDYLDAGQKSLKNVDCLVSLIDQVLDQEGVNIDQGCAEFLTNILYDWGKMRPIQQMFIQQQRKSPACKGLSEMRWHPTMIRLALFIQSTSKADHTAVQVSGIIKLSENRTLFDYTPLIHGSEEVFNQKLIVTGKKLENSEEDYEKYFCLLMDEIRISQNLVFRKTDGVLVGYLNLEEVEDEVKKLQDCIVNKEERRFQLTVTTKALVYMIKGCTTGETQVVASFASSSLTKTQLFSRTWQVIRACEGNGIKILALVFDGSSTYRSFIAMHTPATPSEHGVIFDTVNMCALDRKIYFITDPPHLLRTIRNCFAKSGTKETSTRLLTMKGQFIEWKTIEKLYLEDKNKTLRAFHKLNSQNVYLNSYSCMKVSYAAQVMSRTVALDLKDRNWPGTEATVDFILKVNDFFSCFNGCEVDASLKKVNERLAAYTDINDKRFHELIEFEKYISDWQNEVNNLPEVPHSHKAKMTLSCQTVQGIHMTVNGFIGAVKYLLGLGANYVYGRAFCQDPREQYFSEQRASLVEQKDQPAPEVSLLT